VRAAQLADQPIAFLAATLMVCLAAFLASNMTGRVDAHTAFVISPHVNRYAVTGATRR
jgi:hypothetical protein